MRAAWERRGSITEEEGVRGLVSFSGATVGGTSRRKRKGKKRRPVVSFSGAHGRWHTPLR